MIVETEYIYSLYTAKPDLWHKHNWMEECEQESTLYSLVYPFVLGVMLCMRGSPHTWGQDLETSCLKNWELL